MLTRYDTPQDYNKWYGTEVKLMREAQIYTVTQQKSSIYNWNSLLSFASNFIWEPDSPLIASTYFDFDHFNRLNSIAH